jgi:hypothetical protein
VLAYNVGVIGQGNPGGPVPSLDNSLLPMGVLGLGLGVVEVGGVEVGGVEVGVQGIGPTFGVQGSSLSEDGSQSIGVQGSSVQGVGVWGTSSGDLSAPIPIDPYRGVLGSAQINATLPFPIDGGAFTNNLATGVIGVGDNYGGAFHATPQLDASLGISPSFANIQLTPIGLHDNREGIDTRPFPPQKPAIAPALPLQGQPGDIIVVNPIDQGLEGVQVWICLLAPPANGFLSATWARVAFDYVYQAKL